MSSTTPTSLASSLNEVYPVFEPNQLLTSNHLNQLRNYLDTQDRLSRVKLIGIGILCGLDVTFETNRIKISKGTGITSEGFLINLEEESFSRCSTVNYTDSQAYPLFLATESTQIPMWELVPDTVSANVNLFASPTPVNFLQNKVVVLFMEYKDIDLETCLTQNCDQKGINREFKIRKLLIQCTDVDKIIRTGYGIVPADSLNDAFNDRFNPVYAAMRSFTLLPSDSLPPSWNSFLVGIDSAQDLIDRYKAIYPDDETNPLYILATKINEAYTTYEPLLKGIGTSGDVSLIRATFTSYLNLVKNTSAIQYYYQFSKDVVYAYNEFVDLAFELVAECSPNETRFPRHLVLGKVKDDGICPENTQPCRPSLYRTHFIQTPIYNSQKEKLAEMRNSFKRLLEMIYKFSTSIAIDAPLKITPSKEKSGELGDRSIPFYYNPATDLYKVWNFNFAKKCKSQWNLGYRSDQFLPAIPSSQTPLEFDMDPFDFYRIESIIGKSYKTVASQLNELKRKHQLDFDILPLKLNLSASSPRMNNCGLQDLKEAYVQLRSEIIIELTKFEEFYKKITFFIELGKELGGKKKGDLLVEEKKIIEGDYYDFDPNKISARIKKLLRNLPICIEDFQPEDFLKSFKFINEATLIVVIQLETILRNSKVKTIGIEFILNRMLIGGGFFESVQGLYARLLDTKDIRLSLLYYSYTKRLKLLQNQTLFSNFAIKNSGLTPLAGVPKGGTFIMVYDRDGGNENVIVDFAVRGKVTCEEQFAFCGSDSKEMPIIPRDIYVFIDESHDLGEPFFIDISKHSVDLNGENRPPNLSGVEIEVSSRFDADIFIVKDEKLESEIIGYKVPKEILKYFELLAKEVKEAADYTPAVSEGYDRKGDVVAKEKGEFTAFDKADRAEVVKKMEELLDKVTTKEDVIVEKFDEYVIEDKRKRAAISEKFDEFLQKDGSLKIKRAEEFKEFIDKSEGEDTIEKLDVFSKDDRAAKAEILIKFKDFIDQDESEKSTYILEFTSSIEKATESSSLDDFKEFMVKNKGEKGDVFTKFEEFVGDDKSKKDAIFDKFDEKASEEDVEKVKLFERFKEIIEARESEKKDVGAKEKSEFTTFDKADRVEVVKKIEELIKQVPAKEDVIVEKFDEYVIEDKRKRAAISEKFDEFLQKDGSLKIKRAEEFKEFIDKSEGEDTIEKLDAFSKDDRAAKAEILIKFKDFIDQDESEKSKYILEFTSSLEKDKKSSSLDDFKEFMARKEGEKGDVLDQFEEFIGEDKTKKADILDKLDEKVSKEDIENTKALERFKEIIKARESEKVEEVIPVKDYIRDGKDLIRDDRDPREILPYDVFDYEIMSDADMVTKALVYVVFVPKFSSAQFLESLCCGEKEVIIKDPVVDPIEDPDPIVKDPIVKDPIVKDPIVKDPIVKDPIVKDPDPIVKDPIVKDPIVKDPIVKDPDPIVKDPIVKDPDPIVKDPIVKDPDPIVKDPIVKDPDPIVKDPIVKDPDPIVKDPFVKEPDPVVKDPIVKDPDPIVKDPIVKDPDPVVKDPVKDPFADFVRDFDVKGGDVVARESSVIKTFGSVLTSTSEEILKLDEEIGAAPLNRSELAVFLKINKDKLAKRDGLVASFERDLEDFFNIVGNDRLGTNTKGDVSSFIERDLKTVYNNIKHLLVNSDAIITGFADRDDVGLPLKGVVSGLKG